MKDHLFTIVCTTCQAELKVREKGLIGQIVACPKCGSMVEVVPPEPSDDSVASEGPTSPEKRPPAEGHLPAVGPSSAEAPPRKVVPPPLPPSAVRRSRSRQPAVEEAVRPQEKGGDVAEEVPSPEEATPVEQIAWRRRVWAIAGSVAAVLLLCGVYFLFIRSTGTQPPNIPGAASNQPKTVVPAQWIPPDAQLVVRVTRTKSNPQAVERLLDATDADFKAASARFLDGFGLRREGIEEITVALTGERFSSDRAVIAVRLREGQDASLLETTGEAVPLKLADLKWFRRPSKWAHPYAVLDRRTFVTGPEEALDSTVAEANAEEKTDTASPLLAPLGDRWALAVVIRASIWKKTAVPSVSAWLGAWPKAAGAWKKLAGRADGIAWFVSDDPAKCRLGLAAPDEASANQLSEDATALLDALGKTMVPDESVKQSALVGQAVDALRKSPPTTKEASVWIDAVTDPPPLELLAELAEGAGRLQAWRSIAGRKALEEKQAAASKGLQQFAEKNGKFPKGVVGRGLLPPETRLSWIATMLPFYGRPDWVKDMDFSYGWKDEQNADVTKRLLEAVVNPILGPQFDEEGFPVTHFVGVAGVGADAAQLPEGDPAAGVFGYDRQTSLEDIEDGAGNTIAILGVIGELGPWAAGGKGSVRGISGRPVVSGPDGFGSGLPDGMIAGMADGSVRFISKDIDPKVLEQMATIRGGEGKKPEPKPPGAGKPEAGEQKPKIDEKEASANAEVKIRLAERVPRFVFREKPLEVVVEAIGELGNIRIRFDEAALQAQKISVTTNVTVDMAGASLDDLLRNALRQVNLAYRIDKGGITVFPVK